MESETPTMEQPILPSSEDGFSEPAGRPWGSPPHQDHMVSPALALLIGKDEGTSPVAIKILDTS